LPPGCGLDDWLEHHTVEEYRAIVARTRPEGIRGFQPHNFPAEADIPAWDFLYDKHLLRGTVSVTAATGETGKSTKSITEALAQATGKALLGISPTRKLRVLLINLEDDRKAMDKRIQAAMKHYGLKPEDVGDRLTVIAKGELKIKIAIQVRQGVIKPDEVMIKGLIDFLIQHKIDVVSIDPLRKMHRVPENDIVGMGEVIECFEDIAEAANCSIHIWHHLRKANGTEATIDSVRGASSIVDAARSCEVMEKMTKEEAKRCRIEEHLRRFYFRSFNGKINFAPPIEQSAWYHIKSVELNNDFPFGDNVSVVTRWDHPGAKDLNPSPGDIEAIKRELADGFWREDTRAAMWAGKAVAQVLKLDTETDRDAIKALLKKLIEIGQLKIVYKNDEKRMKRGFIIPA
jgi:AAA domain